MADTAEPLRRALANTRPRWNPAGYPDDLRARVSAWIRARRAAGASWSELTEALEISRGTVLRWAEEGAPNGGFLPVHLSSAALRASVTPAPPVVGPVLVTPRGYRVEGLDAETLSSLLERLG